MFETTASLTRVLPLAAALSLASCRSTVEAQDATPAAQAATQGEQAGAASPEAKAGEVEEKTFALAMARIELELAKLSTGAQRAAAEQSLARAEREQIEAQKALEQFKQVEMPQRVQDGELGVERAKFGIEMKKIELEELVAMYKNDQFAASTKEIVVKRETKELEFMQRGLALAEARFAALTAYELPKDLAGKEDGARKAEEALAKARVESAKTQLEVQKSLAEAERKIAKLEKELAKLEQGAAKP